MRTFAVGIALGMAFVSSTPVRAQSGVAQPPVTLAELRAADALADHLDREAARARRDAGRASRAARLARSRARRTNAHWTDGTRARRLEQRAHSEHGAALRLRGRARRARLEAERLEAAYRPLPRLRIPLPSLLIPRVPTSLDP